MMATKMDRRKFLGWAATGAAGLLLPTVVRPRPNVFDMGHKISDVSPWYLDAQFDVEQWLRDEFRRVIFEMRGCKYVIDGYGKS